MVPGFTLMLENEHWRSELEHSDEARDLASSRTKCSTSEVGIASGVGKQTGSCGEREQEAVPSERAASSARVRERIRMAVPGLLGKSESARADARALGGIEGFVDG